MSWTAGLAAGGQLRQAADALVRYAAELGLRPVVTSVRRSRARQAALYKAWVTGKARFPAAPPGTSKHERGLAFDISVRPESALRHLGEVWESIGGVWGGRFRHPDPIHFEAP